MTSRAEKAADLPVVKLGPGQYKVGREYVDLSASDPCHCADAIWRNAQCKHILAARAYGRSGTTTPRE